MQQPNPPQGRLFPDSPQPQSAPRFASNAPHSAQPYEPQQRMQQTGAVPTMTVPRYATGQLQALHGSTPASQMPPMASMPTAQAYQAQQGQTPAPSAESAQTATPLMVHTLQGVPVVVSAEEMRRALEDLDRKNGRKTAKDSGKKKKKRGRFSIVWFVFGLIGVGATLLLLLEHVVIPLLVALNGLTGGAL